MLVNIAALNLRKNFSFYKLYIISLTIIISIYVAFQSFAHDTIMLKKISSDGRVESMSNIINIFFILFVVFFMIYFNSFFIKKRYRELGIYSLLGFSKKKISLLLIYESILITFLSLLLSIFIGSMLYMIINKTLIKILEIKVLNRENLINIISIYNSFKLIVIMTLAIIFSNTYEIKKLTLINLVNYSKRKEKLIKKRPFLGLIGIILLLTGYLLSVNIIKGKNSIWAKIGYMPITFLVLLSTVLGSILVLKYSISLILFKLRQKKKIVYTQVNNIIIPRFIYRMSSKSNILIIVTLLISITISMLSSLVLTLYFPIKATERINPSAIEFTINNKEVLMDFKTLKKDDGIFINYYPNNEVLNKKYKLKLKNSNHIKTINIIENTIKNPISFSNSMATFVVSDKTFNKIKLDNSINEKIVFALNGENLRNNKEFYDKIHNIIKDKDKGFTSSYERNSMIKEANGSTFLLLTFITILFFITTGNILYFTNLVETLNVKDEYSILKKIGYSSNLIKQIIKKEVFLIYMIPLIIGILNGIFALIYYRYLLIDNLLGNLNILKVPLIYTFSIFLIIYIIFYLITTNQCEKISLTN